MDPRAKNKPQNMAAENLSVLVKRGRAIGRYTPTMKHRHSADVQGEDKTVEQTAIMRCAERGKPRDLEKIAAVQRMQDAISQRAADPDFTIEDAYAQSGYSPRHAERLFRELTERSVGDYLRAVRLTKSSERLLASRDAVLDIALDAGFDSHEGFSRAFFKVFRVHPQSYRKDPVPIPLFIQYPVRSYLAFLQQQKEEGNMEQQEAREAILCTVTTVSRPKRKLMLLRSEHATDYWTFCEEKGCDWTGLLNSIPEKLDISGLIELPRQLVKPGTSAVGAGVELPADYDGKKVPAGYELIDLEPCEMLYFQTEPYEDEEAFCVAIDAAQRAYARYDPSRYGLAYAFERAPKFNYGADTTMGAKLSMPVVRI